MKANLVPLIKKSALEESIAEYDYLGKQIKALEAERNKLRESLIKSHFSNNPEYVDANGVVLAVYSEVERKGFDAKAFAEYDARTYAKFETSTKYMQLKVK